jgi:hypothetical protein
MIKKLEVTGGFEPPALRFCKPFPWTTRARHLKTKKGTPYSEVPLVLSMNLSDYASRITYLSLPSSTISLSSLPTLKNGTFLGETLTTLPVLGFRPSYAL